MSETWFTEGNPITILAGAGVSATAPSALPGWWTLNSEVVAALARRLEEITADPEMSDNFRDAIHHRRESTPFLAPDLQAQLMEDEIGGAYFDALSAVDSHEINLTHATIAQLAKVGRVGAIVTTNFDTLLERSLDLADVPYRCFASPAEFEELGHVVPGLKLVKLHGSANRPDTMVDTLRQRIQGRPESLLTWLRQRFLSAPTLGLGFSGDDLGYRDDYLAIQPSIEEGAKFGFLVRSGGTPSKPLITLAEKAPDRVTLFSGELPQWLLEVTNTQVPFPQPRPADHESAQQESLQRLRDALTQWSGGLDNLEVINAVSSLLIAAGQRDQADKLLEDAYQNRAWRAHAATLATARLCFNRGEMFFRLGRFRPEDRDRDPQRWFFNANRLVPSLPYKSHDLLSRFLRGEPLNIRNENTQQTLGEETVECWGLLEKQMSTEGAPLFIADTCFALSELLEFLASGQLAASVLENAHRISTLSGDEFRRAEAAWRLARNLSFASSDDSSQHNSERVRALCDECVQISARLDIRESDAGAAIARSIEAVAVGEWDAAHAFARQAVDRYTAVNHQYGVFLATRESLRALIGKGQDVGTMPAQPFDDMSVFLQKFSRVHAPGLGPLVSLELARWSRYFDDTLARELAEDARDAGDAQAHPSIPDQARKLLTEMSTTSD